MRGSLLPARLLTAALSPNTVTEGQTVTQLASVTNASNVKESVTIRIIGAQASTAPQTFAAILQPGGTFSRSVSFPAALLKPGTHTLTVVGINNSTGGSAQATASISVN